MDPENVWLGLVREAVKASKNLLDWHELPTPEPWYPIPASVRTDREITNRILANQILILEILKEMMETK